MATGTGNKKNFPVDVKGVGKNKYKLGIKLTKRGIQSSLYLAVTLWEWRGN